MNSYTSKKLKGLLYQVNRAIKVQGETYLFTQSSYNEFGEPEEGDKVVEINGLWHTSNSFIQQTVSEATKISSKQQPQILCEYENAKELCKDTILKHDGVTYKVLDIVNLGNFNTIADICLEVVYE